MNSNSLNKSRFKTYEKNVLIELNPLTISLTLIIFVSIFFCTFIILLLQNKPIWSLFQKPPAEAQSKQIEIKSGQSIPLKVTFIPTDLKDEVASLPQKKEAKKDSATKEIKKENKAPAISQHIQAKPQPPKQITTPKPPKKEVSKEEPSTHTENKKPHNPDLDFKETSAPLDPDEVFSISSEMDKIKQSPEQKKYRNFLEAQIKEKINVYQDYFPDNWKHKAAAYIVTVDVLKNASPQINFDTKSTNFFFNQVVERIMHDLQFPPLENYQIDKYHQVFIIVYRPSK